MTGGKVSITLSEGFNLDLETTALAVIAWMNDQERYADEIEKAMRWIISQI